MERNSIIPRVLSSKKTEILNDGTRVYHSCRRNEIFRSITKADELLMDKCDIVMMAPGYYGAFKSLMPALAKEEELAISKGKTIMYESIFNISTEERLEEESLVDSLVREMENGRS